MNAGTIIVEVIGSAGGAAGVGGFALALWARGSSKRDREAELQRTVDAAKTKTAIESAIIDAQKPLLKRFDQNDALTRATVTRVDKLEMSQFGPNGGGLREAVNKSAEKIDHLVSEQSDIKERVVAVETKFDMPRPRATKSV